MQIPYKTVNMWCWIPGTLYCHEDPYLLSGSSSTWVYGITASNKGSSNKPAQGAHPLVRMRNEWIGPKGCEGSCQQLLLRKSRVNSIPTYLCRQRSLIQFFSGRWTPCAKWSLNTSEVDAVRHARCKWLPQQNITLHQLYFAELSQQICCSPAQLSDEAGRAWLNSLT